MATPEEIWQEIEELAPRVRALHARSERSSEISGKAIEIAGKHYQEYATESIRLGNLLQEYQKVGHKKGRPKKLGRK